MKKNVKIKTFKPKVSIVIPAYNEEKTIKRTIISLKNQTYKNFEMIVVDNNSTDKTNEIASKYAKTVVEKKQGYIAAVIKGISETNGDIIAVCDADSIYKPKWLESMLKPFKKKGVVAVYGTSRFYDTNVLFSYFSLIFYSIFLVISRLLGLDNTAGFNFIFSRKAYNLCGGYDLSWKWGSPDIELGKRLKKVGKIKLKFVSALTSSRRFKKKGFLKTTVMFLKMWLSLIKNEKPKISYTEYNKNRR